LHGNHDSKCGEHVKGLTFVFAVAGAVLAAAQAPAGDWKAQPLAVKRQLVVQVIECMKKRMSGDRHISYNQAAKQCRDEVERHLEKASAEPMVAADTPAK
jgi:hypothetical protein